MEFSGRPIRTNHLSSRGSPVLRGSRMRMFREDEEGLTHIIEFTFSLIIVILILAGYFTAVESEFILHTTDDSKREHECIRFSEILIEDTGSARISANVTTSQWETLDAADLHENLIRPGFGMEGSPFGILSMEKIRGLRNITYTDLRTILAIERYNFNIEITDLSGNPIAFFGYSQSGASKISEAHRVILIDDGNGTTVAKLAFRLFEGVNRRVLVRVNELMYFPEEGKNEWVEFYNPSNEAVDLSTMGFYTQKGQTFRDLLMGDSLILPGGGYGILVDDPATVNQYNFSSEAIIFTPTDDFISKGGLVDEGMGMFIQGETFEPQSYSYNNTLGAAGNGRSLEWSLSRGSWRQSTVIGGTPGYMNSQS